MINGGGRKNRIKLHFVEKAPTVTEDLVPDEAKFQVFQVCEIRRLNSGNISSAGFHGLSVPILQPASVDAQLCRAFRVRFLLD